MVMAIDLERNGAVQLGGFFDDHASRDWEVGDEDLRLAVLAADGQFFGGDGLEARGGRLAVKRESPARRSCKEREGELARCAESRAPLAPSETSRNR